MKSTANDANYAGMFNTVMSSSRIANITALIDEAIARKSKVHQHKPVEMDIFKTLQKAEQLDLSVAELKTLDGDIHFLIEHGLQHPTTDLLDHIKRIMKLLSEQGDLRFPRMIRIIENMVLPEAVRNRPVSRHHGGSSR